MLEGIIIGCACYLLVTCLIELADQREASHWRGVTRAAPNAAEYAASLLDASLGLIFAELLNQISILMYRHSLRLNSFQGMLFLVLAC